MVYLVIGVVLFIGMHSISIINEPLRDRLCAKFGELGWKGIYSVISLVGFVLLIYGYGEARQNPTVLYTTPAWFHYINMVLMLFVFPLFLAANFPGKIKILSGTEIVSGLLFGTFSISLIMSWVRYPIRFK